MRRRATLAAIIVLLLARTMEIRNLQAQTTAPSAPATDLLKQGFENPPNSARPRVWWHWMNGNITRQGIKLDLEWMHRVGLGGFQNFDAALRTPQVVDHRLVYMTPEWKQTFLYATRLADSLGLEEAIASSPGWSETGGPWVPAAEGMKKYVWSETTVAGGKPFTGVLARPPAVTGPFQNIPFAPEPSMPGEKQPSIPSEFYRDSAVVAYRIPVNDVPIADLHPQITTSSGNIETRLLDDGDYAHAIDLPSAAAGQEAWIRYAFDTPVRLQALTLVLGSAPSPPMLSTNHGESEAWLEASDDGKVFHRVVRIDGGDVGTTLSFPPVTARYFQVAFFAVAPRTLPALENDPDAWMGIHTATTDAPHFEHIAELVLSTGPRVRHFQEKAAFTTEDNIYRFATPEIAADEAIAKTNVIDLTARMRGDGSLAWTPPPGRWTILRLGYSLLGITNHPAPAEATGLEVDKLNSSYVKNYMDRYLDSYRDAVGSAWMGRRGIRYVVTDSWEAGAQNWTDNMLAEFNRRRGYDPHPWLPVLTGHIVESAEASDAFLWDFRRTIEDLTADEHYGQVQASLKARHLGHYGESHEGGRALIADGMEVKKLDEVPMSAMWTQRPGVNNELFGYNADDRESASVAHIYGQNFAAAESMTAVHDPWAWSPATLKPTADKEMAEGINRFVIHCSVHQPLIGKAPGLGLGPYGQWFNRNETWAEQARPWVEYLARSSYLLQQGRFSADVLYYYGEDSNITAIFGGRSPNIPEGYQFDYVNPDALMHMITVRDGKLATASGMRYQVLVLDPFASHMSLPVLRSIRALVRDGAIVVGSRPTSTPSLADDPVQFNRVADEVWGTAPGVHALGKGRVFSGMALDAVLSALNVAPDFSYSKPNPETKLLFVHRKLKDGDVYFVDNRSDRPQSVDAHFRVRGKEPELWRAESGKTEDAAFKVENGTTTVPLQLEAWGTVFVVFRKAAESNEHMLPIMKETTLATLDGPWKVRFQPGRGAPAVATFDRLQSWALSADEGVKYFSGTGMYAKTIVAPRTWFTPRAQLWLDLGDVKNLAEVTINGHSMGTVWHAPYRVNATAVLKPGANRIEVRVTNAWVNRLIGDLQPGAKQYTFTVIHPYTAQSPLQASGLLGPLTVQSIQAR